MIYELSNQDIQITIDSFGAELKSLIKNGQEYMWQADPHFWGRTSPVLFPFVGSCVDKQYSYDGQIYDMGQHGFARDHEFELIYKDDTSIWFRFVETKETMAVYPFQFALDIGYEIVESSVTVRWIVTNTGNKTLHFSLGAHPAFMCPFTGEDVQTDCYIDFHTDKDITYGIVNGQGTYTDTRRTLALEDGMYQIKTNLFDEDALVIEDRQTSQISLCDSHKNPYVTLSFDTPLVGVWSPVHKNAPFVCIEPWYGRCDHENFTSSLKDRAYSNQLEPFETFKKAYTIKV